MFGVKLSDSLALPRELARASSTTVWQLGSPGRPLRIAGLSGRIIAPDGQFWLALELPTCRVTNDTKQLIDIMTYCL